MCRRQSLRLMSTAHRRLSMFDALLFQSVATAEYRHAQEPRGCRVMCVTVVTHARYGHPLRFYIRPHFRKCSPVVPLKLHLVSPTASRPSGFPKQALCKVAFAGTGASAVGAPRSLARPTRRRLCALVLVVALGISQALRAVFWSVACGQSSCVCPRPPSGPCPLRGRWPRAVCPSAPQGGSLRTAHLSYWVLLQT